MIYTKKPFRKLDIAENVMKKLNTAEKVVKTKHAEIRSQQRGISHGIEYLLQVYGDARPAPGSCLIRYFGKKAIKEIESIYGHSFIAKNHEKLKTYLIETRDDQVVITVGKLYQDQRLTTSKPNRFYH